MLNVPWAPATLASGLNAASPASGSVTVSVPPVDTVVSSMVAPLAAPPITAESATGVTSIVIWLGTVSKAPALSCTLKPKLA